MSDPAQRAAERIADEFPLAVTGENTEGNRRQLAMLAELRRRNTDRWASIIRGEYIALHAMQARAEHLEAVVAKAREEVERLLPSCYDKRQILAILNESQPNEQDRDTSGR